jgi:CTP synthase
MRKKFIFVTGGVLSSLGKGLSAAAIGALLEARGIRVTNLKMDPYINVDPGTMSPYQHGEVFVTDDGAETDLDLGHYERFVARPVSQRNSFSAGRIYRNVIERERRGEYLGRTVQVIPHITDEIKRLIWEAVTEVDVGIIEVGGTVGDIESLPFLEAIRQFRADAGPENVLYVHLTLVPFIKTSGELKTKPTQHSVKELRSIGIQPDILLCRCDEVLPKDIREKIGLFCSLGVESVISAPDVTYLYELPLVFHGQDLDDRILSKLGIWAAEPHLERWKEHVERWRNARQRARIAIVGKYVHIADTYKSLNEALHHGAVHHDARVELVFVDSETIDPQAPERLLGGADAILVPGGFGERGIEGKIAAVQYARTQGVPFFGICLGLHMAVIEYARHVLGWTDANSREFTSASEHLVVDLMDEQRQVTDKGGTMRLGSFPCALQAGSLAARVYGTTRIDERHRHRYELHPALGRQIEEAGLLVSGRSPDGLLAEMIELPGHPYFIACQFHPEFKSRPLVPHPLFSSFVRAALDHRAQRAAREDGGARLDAEPAPRADAGIRPEA